MPRKRILNERDAAMFLADMALKAKQGKIDMATLQIYTNSMLAVGNLCKQRLDSVRARKNQAVVDNLRDELEEKLPNSLGHRLDYHEQIAKIRVK